MTDLDKILRDGSLRKVIRDCLEYGRLIRDHFERDSLRLDVLVVGTLRRDYLGCGNYTRNYLGVAVFDEIAFELGNLEEYGKLMQYRLASFYDVTKINYKKN